MKVAETKISPQWATVIPLAVRPWLKVETGDTVEWYVENDGKVVVKKQ